MLASLATKMLVSLLTKEFVSKVILSLLEDKAKKTDTKVDDALVRAFKAAANL